MAESYTNPAAMEPMLVDEGEIPRARVREITGKGATVAAEIVKKGLKAGYFRSPSPKGVLRLAFPEQMREALFPKLYFPGGSEEGRGALIDSILAKIPPNEPLEPLDRKI